jgi:hypothetical protein
MGLLSDDYFNSLEKKTAPQAAQPAVPVAPQPSVPGSQPQPVAPQPQPQAPIISERKSTLSYLPKELMSTVGLRLPDDQTWDTMTFGQKAIEVGKASIATGGRLIKELPREIVKAPLRVAATIIAPWESLARGEKADFDTLAKVPKIQLPWIGEVPTYFQSFDEAQKSGMGPLAATLSTIGTAAGDVSLVGSLGEAMSTAFRPRAKLVPGETLQNVAPIKQALIPAEEGAIKAVSKPVGSVSEYYTIPKTVAKDQFGGSTNNTFLKMTPAGADSIELSVVQVRTGAIPKTIDYVKNKIGIPDKAYQGDFGREIKLQSQIIKTNPE